MRTDRSPRGRVVVLGELMLDVLLAPAPHVRAGGSAGTVALALAARGSRVTLLGRLGPDPNGNWVAAALSAAGVDVPVPPVPSAPTGYVILRREATPAEAEDLGRHGAGSGDRGGCPGRIRDRVAYVERGANRFLGWSDVTGRLAGGGVAWLHVSGYCLIDPAPAEAARLLALEARQARIPVSLDPGVPRAFRGVPPAELGELFHLGLEGGPDVLLPSEAMAIHLADGPGDAGGAGAVLAGRFRHVAVKEGPTGAWVDGDRIPVPRGRAVPGADVNGAGDVWNAAFIAASLDGSSRHEAARRANALASRFVAGSLSPARAGWQRTESREPPVLVSACLLGIASAYNGLAKGPRARAPWNQTPGRRLGLPVCPEQLGGLGTPRCPSEIQGRGGGEAVMDGRAGVTDRTGRDVTALFLRGAERASELARATGARRAVLSEGSPSCGTRRIHDGTFSGRQVAGLGVAAAALARDGIHLISDEPTAGFGRPVPRSRNRSPQSPPPPPPEPGGPPRAAPGRRG